jgi:hypothetical protein
MKTRKYYEKEAQLLQDHQKEMYFGDAWNRYRHGTRFHMLLKLMKTLKFTKILEVVFAEGYYLKFTGTKHQSTEPHKFGLDISKGYLTKAKINAPKATLILGDASNLPFRDNCFDLVLCTELIEHVREPKKVFSELARTSNKFILLTVAGENLFYYLMTKLKLIKPEKDPYLEAGHGHLNEMKINKIILEWAPEKHLKPIKHYITCHFPIAFLQKYKIPTLFIPLIQFADKLIDHLPVIREYGSSQIGLLEKTARYRRNT